MWSWLHLKHLEHLVPETLVEIVRYDAVDMIGGVRADCQVVDRIRRGVVVGHEDVDSNSVSTPDRQLSIPPWDPEPAKLVARHNVDSVYPCHDISHVTFPAYEHRVVIRSIG